ncbi:uncharacterized protein [Aristolochia californica]|uniref:uncharacterized protein n=1 Tax=Aristolochia californica TaxID=171875 RepID=UPI0035D94980
MAGQTTSFTERLLVIAASLLAVLSPLYIDRKPAPDEPETSDGPRIPFYLLPLLLVILIVAINLSRYLDCRFGMSDPYWIHRVGGSSCGLLTLLLVLLLVLKLKTSIMIE